MEIILSPIGKKSLDEILEYLKIYWTEKEISAFQSDIEEFKNILEAGIVKPKKVEPTKNFYAYLLRSKLVTIYYEIINENYIKILLFWANKKDPQLLEKLLNNPIYK